MINLAVGWLKKLTCCSILAIMYAHACINEMGIKSVKIDQWFDLQNRYLQITHVLKATLSQFQLQCTEYHALYALKQEADQAMSINQLQDIVGLSQSAMSRLVQRLADKDGGLIRRCKQGQDKRTVYVRLTDTGDALLEKATAAVNHALADL